jgi:hypothetical protein
MSANIVDFDPVLQAKGYRLKTWDGEDYFLYGPDDHCIYQVKTLGLMSETSIKQVVREEAQGHVKMSHDQRIGIDLLPAVEIWRFEDTRHDLQDLSTHGGDEDWIVILRDEDCSVAYQLEGGRFMNIDHWSRHEYNGDIIWIGAHA